jgi:hypothetical protein
MRNCIILGAGRSGTSMLAGLVHGSGYFMGEALLEPTSANPKGYFESQEINSLTDELIASVVRVRPRRPRGYLYPWRLPSGLLWLADIGVDVELRASTEQLAHIRRLVAREPFCFKDPRFCYTLEAWRPALDDVVFMCVFREPGRTAASMRHNVRDRPYRGFHLTRGHALRSWTSMYQRVLQQHSEPGGEWLFVHYDQILDGSSIPRIEDAIATRASASFVDRNLRRSQDDSSRLPQRTIQTYRQLCELAEFTDRAS